MDTLTLERLLELAQAHGDTRVSLFMPTRRFGPGSQEEDRTRLKNLVRDAEEGLTARGLRAAEVAELLGPIRALGDDRPFWLRSSDGLALLSGPEGLHRFQVPVPVAELVWVGDRYHVRPLFGALAASRTFWLLALSQKRVRLLSGNGYGLEEVPAEGIPSSLGDALRWDDYEKNSLQFHTGTSGSGGRRPAVFHGTGETDVKDELVRYFRGIDAGLHDLVKESDAPLVLAGVDYLLPLYRDVNSYPHLAAETIQGNPDGLGDAELHERAWAIVDGVFADEHRSAAERVVELWASPRVTSDPEALVPAAHHGRVDTLLLAEGAHWWGTLNADAGEVIVNPHAADGDEDLLDRAAVETLANGGRVITIAAGEMPHGKDAVALLRY
ncbi:MAG TPA: hypothetical protein VLQ52_07060 [Coriobacteriia bacterium]|nr:hypothetical protein [Coriobacteriia bacterium]